MRSSQGFYGVIARMSNAGNKAQPCDGGVQGRRLIAVGLMIETGPANGRSVFGL